MGYLSRYLNWHFSPKYGVWGHGCSTWDEYKNKYPIIDYGTEELISDFVNCNFALGLTLVWLAIPVAIALDFHVAEFVAALIVSCILQVAAFAIDVLLHPAEHIAQSPPSL